MSAKTRRQRELDEMMRKEIERIERDGVYQTNHLELHRGGRRRLDRRDANTKAMRRDAPRPGRTKPAGIP
jgi:hypothetical protein